MNDTDRVEQRVLSVIQDQECLNLGACEFLPCACVNKIIAAHIAALAEAGLVIVPRESGSGRMN